MTVDHFPAPYDAVTISYQVQRALVEDANHRYAGHGKLTKGEVDMAAGGG